MAARLAAFRVPVDQTPSDAALLIVAAWTAVAAAWKSPICSVVDPENPVPFCTSTQHVPCVVNGFVPVTDPRSRRRVTEVIVAPSGIEAVLNETTALYWRS